MRLPRLLSLLLAAVVLAARYGHAWWMPVVVVGSSGLKRGSTSLAVAGGGWPAGAAARVERGARGHKPMTMQISMAAAAGRDGGVGVWLDPREAVRPSLQAAEARFLQHLDACPFIAVLRGVQAQDVAPTIQALAAEGFTLASVPAEAPAGLAALRGREVQQQLSSDDLMLGAATVISLEQVDRAAEAGAAFISCPHVDPEIIERSTARGLVVLPGVLTPTEAFLAVKHGARILKLFPSQAIPPGMVKSLRAVLPPHVQLLVSGGVQPEDMPAYLRAGALGFALGSTLYSPGLDADELRRRARLFRDAVERGRETDAWAAATLGL